MKKYFGEDYFGDHPVWHSMLLVLGTYLLALLAVILSGSLAR
jgi:hypothetical protein